MSVRPTSEATSHHGHASAGPSGRASPVGRAPPLGPNDADSPPLTVTQTVLAVEHHRTPCSERIYVSVEGSTVRPALIGFRCR